MGSLYWQLNDVWPGASWSSVDYFGRWKALQFHARRFYAPVRVVAIHNDGHSDVFVVSDRTAPFQATLRSRVMSMEGKVLRERKQALKVEPLASTKVASPTDAELLRKADPAASFAVYELLDDKGAVLSRHLLFVKPPIELKLPDPDLKAELRDNGQGGVLVLSARHLAREVWVDFGTLDATPDDNAFSLLPGETRELRVVSEAGIDALRGALRVRSLAGATKGDAK